MGKASRTKGCSYERALVNLLQEAGIAAERVPLSGGAGGKFSGDVDVPYLGQDHRFEAKIRADGFRELYKWLEDHTGLFVRADRKDTLVVLRLSDFTSLIAMAEDRRSLADAAAA